MRIYSAPSEEALRARSLLANWAKDGFITRTQYEHLKQQTVSDLRTTNIFLRIVLFLFTLIVVGGALGLTFVAFLKGSSDQFQGVALIFFAMVCYAAAEVAASRGHLYRYGIEEALASCSVVLLCLGIQFASFDGHFYSPLEHELQFLVPLTGGAFALWIWHRFGLWYAFPAAMICAAIVPGFWTQSFSVERGIIVFFYAIGLVCLAALRSRRNLNDNENDAYEEAFLWLGIYLAINVILSAGSLRALLSGARVPGAPEFPRIVYWATWVLTWCLPPMILVRGLSRKDRSVIAVGALTAGLTLVTNKPYLGWPRHTWDPMLLGIFLAAVALFVRHWLAGGNGGVRHGYTAARRSGKDKHWVDAGSAVAGLVTAPVTPNPQPSSADFRFGGGATGGGGAGGNF